MSVAAGSATAAPRSRAPTSPRTGPPRRRRRPTPRARRRTSMAFLTKAHPTATVHVENLAALTAEVEAASAARDAAERTHKAMEHAFDLATGDEREAFQTQCTDARQAA